MSVLLPLAVAGGLALAGAARQDRSHLGAWHAGDGGTGIDSTLGNMSWGRHSGHFGTGTYFVSHPDKLKASRGDRPLVDLSPRLAGKRLWTPTTPEEAYRAFQALRSMNNLVAMAPETEEELGEAMERLVARLYEAFPELRKKRGWSAGFGETIEFCIAETRDRAYWRADSASTRFLRRVLGADGVDVRGLEDFDDTYTGSVLFRDADDPAVRGVPASSGWKGGSGARETRLPASAKEPTRDWWIAVPDDAGGMELVEGPFTRAEARAFFDAECGPRCRIVQKKAGGRNVVRAQARVVELPVGTPLYHGTAADFEGLPRASRQKPGWFAPNRGEAIFYASPAWKAVSQKPQRGDGRVVVAQVARPLRLLLGKSYSDFGLAKLDEAHLTAAVQAAGAEGWALGYDVRRIAGMALLSTDGLRFVRSQAAGSAARRASVDPAAKRQADNRFKETYQVATMRAGELVGRDRLVRDAVARLGRSVFDRIRALPAPERRRRVEAIVEDHAWMRGRKGQILARWLDDIEDRVFTDLLDAPRAT